MAYRNRELLHVITDKPNQAKARDSTRELDIFELNLEVFLRLSLKDLLRIVISNSVLSLLSPIVKVEELPVAVVNKLYHAIL